MLALVRAVKRVGSSFAVLRNWIAMRVTRSPGNGMKGRVRPRRTSSEPAATQLFNPPVFERSRLISVADRKPLSGILGRRLHAHPRLSSGGSEYRFHWPRFTGITRLGLACRRWRP